MKHACSTRFAADARWLHPSTRRCWPLTEGEKGGSPSLAFSCWTGREEGTRGDTLVPPKVSPSRRGPQQRQLLLCSDVPRACAGSTSPQRTFFAHNACDRRDARASLFTVTFYRANKIEEARNGPFITLATCSLQLVSLLITAPAYGYEVAETLRSRP